MKNTLIFLVFTFTTFVSAQEYTPMLADVNEWHFSTCYQGDCITDRYYTDGDTLVNSKNYKILDGYHYISRSFLLNEEVKNKKVYLLVIFNNTQREYLLYDFSLAVGDVFEMTNPISPFQENGGEFELTNIDLLELEDGNEYKHYYFSPTASNTISDWGVIWVEGVGSLSIPNAPGGNPDFEDVGRVSCAFRDGNLFYSDYTVVTDCSSVLGNVEASTPLNVDFFYQSNGVQVESVDLIQDYTLFTTSGKKLEDQKTINSNSLFINTSIYPSGIYFAKLKSKKDEIVIKIIARKQKGK